MITFLLFVPGPDLMVQTFSVKGTALHPVSFKLKYEFVDTRLGGEQWNVKKTEDYSPCLRIYRRKKKGFIRSPRNVFFYGRGGAKNLSCIYRIEGSPSERVKLTILNASFGGGGGGDNTCLTTIDPHSQRSKCLRDINSDRIVQLSIFTSPWRNLIIPHSCFCDNTTNERSLVMEFSSKAIEIHFKISKFNTTDDFLNLYFNAKFELIKSPECTRRQRVGGSGGEFSFSYPPTTNMDINCQGVPWLVEGYQNMSLFLLTWGTFMNFDPNPDDLGKCPTKNRILIYSGQPAR